jgi:cytosine/creatinine deaminase
MGDVLLRGGRPWGQDGAADVLVRDGRIELIAPGLEAADAELIDVDGRLLLPGLVDAHTHLEDAVRRTLGPALGGGRARGQDRQ